jgi:CBS domain-containing protein
MHPTGGLLKHARDLMEPALTVSPALSVTELAQQLLAADVEAVCVVEADGRLVGVVTGMDLVYREKKVHPPFTITVLDLVLQLGGKRTEQELHKIAATRVGELMTPEVVTASPETAVDELATKMVEQHLSMIPVVEGGRLLGVVTRKAMLGATLRHLLGRA